jgi:hypothetical protein
LSIYSFLSLSMRREEHTPSKKRPEEGTADIHYLGVF